jgi:hypothetical protein
MPNLADAQKPSKKGLGTHHKTQGTEDYSDGGRLKRYAGYITGYAETFAGALNVGREAIIGAAQEVETFMYIDGRRGTDNPGGSTNRTRSEDYPDREGVDKVFIGLTLEQFERLGDEVGAAVEV